MFSVSGRAVRPAAPRPVVIPGPEPTPAACDACGSTTAPVARAVVDGIELAACLDFAGCCARYRFGTGPGTYAACLRGEILGVAP